MTRRRRRVEWSLWIIQNYYSLKFQVYPLHVTAYVIKHVNSGPGWAFTDNQAVFMDRTAAEAYLHRCRRADPESDVEPEDDGWLDTNWYMEELPLGPEVLPVKEDILKPWKVSV